MVGHSHGGAIALQFALDAPDVVHTLALLEPAVLVVEGAEEFLEGLGPAFGVYASGQNEGAIDFLQRAWFGPDYRSALEPVLPPGAFEQAAADADTFFGVEVSAHQEWAFTAEDAPRIGQPVLLVRGADGPPFFREATELLRGGCRRQRRSLRPTRRTPCRCTTRARWPKGWPGFSPATR